MRGYQSDDGKYRLHAESEQSDLGIDRCEIGSFVAESDGSSSLTRRRVVPGNLQVFETSRLRIKSIDRFL